MSKVKRVGSIVSADRSVAFQYMREQVASEMTVFYDVFRTSASSLQGHAEGQHKKQARSSSSSARVHPTKTPA